MRSLSNYDGDVNENSKKSMEQQLCTCITLFCTLLSRCCTTTTENLPIKFDVFKRTWTQNNHFFIYIYICTRFQKVFHIEIYIDRYIGCVRLGNPDLDFENLNPDFSIERTHSFVLLHVRPCAFFTSYCPTCEKTRFNDKFFLRQVLCSNLSIKKRMHEHCLQFSRSAFF